MCFNMYFSQVGTFGGDRVKGQRVNPLSKNVPYRFRKLGDYVLWERSEFSQEGVESPKSLGMGRSA